LQDYEYKKAGNISHAKKLAWSFGRVAGLMQEQAKPPADR